MVSTAFDGPDGAAPAVPEPIASDVATPPSVTATTTDIRLLFISYLLCCGLPLVDIRCDTSTLGTTVTGRQCSHTSHIETPATAKRPRGTYVFSMTSLSCRAFRT